MNIAENTTAMTVQRCLYSLCALAGQGFFISCIIYSLLHWSTKSVRIANTKEKKKGKREAWMTKFRSEIMPQLQLPQCIGCALWPFSCYKKDSLNHKDRLAVWAKFSSPLNFRKKSNLVCPVMWKGPPALGWGFPLQGCQQTYPSTGRWLHLATLTPVFPII